MLNTFLDKANGLVDRRFLVAYWFPTLIVSIAALLLRGAVYGFSATWQWWQRLGPTQGQEKGEYAQIWVLLGVLFLVTLLAYQSQAFTRALVRVYEGYWPQWLRRWARKQVEYHWQQWRRERAKAAQSDFLRYTIMQDRLHYEYPMQAKRLLSTRLGNALASTEDYPSVAYGMDVVFWWRRLFPLLPDTIRKEIDDALTSLLALLNFATMVGLASADGVLYLWRVKAGGWWWPLIILVSGLLLTWLSYRGAVAQAREYGQRIRAAVDLYRFDLLKALHQTLPKTPHEERMLWEQLEAWLYNQDRGAVQGLSYDHGDVEKKAKSKEPQQTMKLKTV